MRIAETSSLAQANVFHGDTVHIGLDEPKIDVTNVSTSTTNNNNNYNNSNAVQSMNNNNNADSSQNDSSQIRIKVRFKNTDKFFKISMVKKEKNLKETFFFH